MQLRKSPSLQEHLHPYGENNAIQIKNQNGSFAAVGTPAILVTFAFVLHEANKFFKTINKPKKRKKRKKKSK